MAALCAGAGAGQARAGGEGRGCSDALFDCTMGSCRDRALTLGFCLSGLGVNAALCGSFSSGLEAKFPSSTKVSSEDLAGHPALLRTTLAPPTLLTSPNTHTI